MQCPALRLGLRAVRMPEMPQQTDEIDEKTGLLKRPFGESKAEEDAFGHTDAFAAIRDSIKQSKVEASNKGADASTPFEASEASAEQVDHVASSANRRRNKTKRNMDTVLNDVLNDALRMRDLGNKPDMDFVYKQTQERMYEAEHGHKPPSQKDTNAKYIPFPPDFKMVRLLPNTIFDDDPWPARSITPENPVLTNHEVQLDKDNNHSKRIKEQEKMYLPRDGCDVIAEFGDAVDELTHWEVKFLTFVRDVPLSQRRTLPLLHEYYRSLTHRVIRAEKRFIKTRDAAMREAKISQDTFKKTEDRVERTRGLYAESHKSLSSPNYDPVTMKKRTLLGEVMAMTPAQFSSWIATERQRGNDLIAEFSTTER